MRRKIENKDKAPKIPAGPRSKVMRKADAAFSLFIRTRDAQPYKGEFFKCISCGRILPIQKADCGHYINRRFIALRFSEMNCHAQCSACNRFIEGNATGYRQGLLEKIGEEKVRLLESQKNNVFKPSAFEIEKIAEYYRAKAKAFPYQINTQKP